MDTAIALMRAGATQTAAAAAIGIRQGHLRYWLLKRGLADELCPGRGRYPRQPLIPEATIDEAIRLIEAGATVREAAAAVGISMRTLSNRRRQRSGRAPQPRKRYTDAEISSALALVADGMPVARAAATIGASGGVLHYLMRRRGVTAQSLRAQHKEAPRAQGAGTPITIP